MGLKHSDDILNPKALIHGYLEWVSFRKTSRVLNIHRTMDLDEFQLNQISYVG